MRATTTKRGYGPGWQRLRLRAFEVYGTHCHLCGEDGADTIDHLDPTSTAGPRLPTIDRVRPAHATCNSSRGNKPLPIPPSRNW